MIKYIVLTYDSADNIDPDTGDEMDLFAYLANELDNQDIRVYLLEFDQAADLVQRFREDCAAAGFALDPEALGQVIDPAGDRS